MYMTSFRLILLRAYNLTLGRVPIFSSLLRKVLLRMLIYNKKDKYVASSGYFDLKELD